MQDILQFHTYFNHHMILNRIPKELYQQQKNKIFGTFHNVGQ